MIVELFLVFVFVCVLRPCIEFQLIPFEIWTKFSQFIARQRRSEFEF